jgi:hypothetical protein
MAEMASNISQKIGKVFIRRLPEAPTDWPFASRVRLVTPVVAIGSRSCCDAKGMTSLEG